MQARLLLAAATILASPAAFGQTTWYVDGDASYGPDIGIHQDPLPTIQAALDLSVHGDEIVVAPGTYYEALDFPGHDVVLRSAHGASVTIIDARRLGAPAVTFPDCARCAPQLEGFTITKGEGVYRDDLGGRVGGGIYIENSRPTIRSCIVFENGARFGGGLFNDAGLPTLVDCIFASNLSKGGAGGAIYNRFGDLTATGCILSSNRSVVSPVSGGAIFTGPFTLLDLADCSLVNNSSGTDGGAITAEVGSELRIRDSFFGGNTTPAWGGAIHIEAAVTASISDCDFIDNWAGFRGGAICATGARVDIASSRFEANLAGTGGAVDLRRGMAQVVGCAFTLNRGLDEGGALRILHGNPLVMNSAFYGNAAPRGAAMQFSGAMPQITNCTIAANIAMPRGGAVRADGASRCWIMNSVIWANAGGPLAHDRTGEMTLAYTDIEGGSPGLGVTAADPMFMDLANGDLRFRAGSPCIDAADNGCVPADVLDLDRDGDVLEPMPLDLHGNTRFACGSSAPDLGLTPWPCVDMGAFEFQAGKAVVLDR